MANYNVSSSYPHLNKNTFQYTLNSIILSCLSSNTYDFLYAKDEKEQERLIKLVQDTYDFAEPLFQNGKVSGFLGVFKVNLASIFDKMNELIEAGCKGYIESVNKVTIEACEQIGIDPKEVITDESMKKQLSILFKKLDYFHHFKPNKINAFPVNGHVLDVHGESTKKDIFTDYYEKYQHMVKTILVESLNEIGDIINNPDAMKARNGRRVNCEIIWDFCGVDMIEDEVMFRVQGEFVYKD